MRNFLILLLFVSTNMFAQVRKDSDDVKFISSYQLAGQLSGGNTNRQLISTNELFSYNIKNITLSTNPSFTYGNKGADNTIAETEYFQTLSFKCSISNTSKIMIFSDIEHSNLRSIFLRYDLGEGYLRKIIDKNGIMFDVSEAIMMEKTQTLQWNNAYDLATTRLSTRIRFNAKIKTKLSTIHVGLVSLIQPAVEQFFLNDRTRSIALKDNFSSRTTLNIDQPITETLSFTIAFNYIVETYSHYLSENSNSVIFSQPIDYSFVVGFKYKSK